MRVVSSCFRNILPQKQKQVFDKNQPVSKTQSPTGFNDVFSFSGTIQNSIKIGEEIIKSTPELASNTKILLDLRKCIFNQALRKNVNPDKAWAKHQMSPKIKDFYEEIRWKVIDLRTASNIAISRQKKKQTLTLPIKACIKKQKSLEYMAGNCEEYAYIAAADSIKKGIERFTIVGAEVIPIPCFQHAMKNHVFEIIHEGNFEKIKYIDDLTKLEDAVIIDVWNRSTGAVDTEIEKIKSLLDIDGGKVRCHILDYYNKQNCIKR